MKKGNGRIASLALVLCLMLEGCVMRAPSPEAAAQAEVPALLYHHLDPNADGTNKLVVSPETFEQQIRALHDAGYTGVSIAEITNYVNQKGTLPERPIIITFDDGYLSNYQYAFPILQKYNMKATIFVIGASVGHMECYKDTTYPITPHFGAAEIEEMIASGLIDIQSHTYDMHQTASYETGVVRRTIQQLPDEDDAHYRYALTEDVRLERELLEPITGGRVNALAYPLGADSPLTAEILQQLGIEVTFSIKSGSNTIERGAPECLYGLRRNCVCETTTSAQLLEMVAPAKG